MSNFFYRLAIEASTPVCSVALLKSDGQEKTLYSRWNQGQGIHSESLFVFTKQVLEEAGISLSQVSELILTTGPGSYTGLRIAASAAKGMVFNSEMRLLGVQTLAFFAFAAFAQNLEASRFHAVIDARRTHLYHQIFERKEGRIVPVNELAIREIEEIRSLLKTGDAIGGTGIHRLFEKEIPSDFIVFKEKELIKADFLAQIPENIPFGNEFISQLEPAIFEPNYYTLGYAQVHTATSKKKN